MAHDGILTWSDESADYIRSRSSRYPGAMDVEPRWCEEALQDPRCAVLIRDPKSRIGASRFIGWSRSAHRTLVVIAYLDDEGRVHGINAWPATGHDLDLYEAVDDDEEPSP